MPVLNRSTCLYRSPSSRVYFLTSTWRKESLSASTTLSSWSIWMTGSEMLALTNARASCVTVNSATRLARWVQHTHRVMWNCEDTFSFISHSPFASSQKLHVFLFTELLVLTRHVTRNEHHCFQVYRQPIPVQHLVLEDLQDGDVRMGGSFRGAFINAEKGESPSCRNISEVVMCYGRNRWVIISFFGSPSAAKNLFRVRSQDPGHAQSHTLQVNDVFHKQQWLNCLRSAISVHRPLAEPPSPSARDTHYKRRPSSISAIIHMEESDENQLRQTSQSAPASPCISATPSPSATATATPPTSPSPALSSPASHKTKKDKKSLYSLGKRKETMVWNVSGVKVPVDFVQNSTSWRKLVFICVCRYSVSVLCYCPLRQLFNSPLYPRTRAETQHSEEECIPQHPKRREAKKTLTTTRLTWESVCCV